MGMTHGEPDTFPRTADMLGFCTPEQAVDIAEKVVTVQRDWGNRENRKRARLKYTIEDRGLDAFRAEVERRLGYKLAAPRPYRFTSTGDPIGWQQSADKKWHLTLFIENGRVKDKPGHALRTALREIAEFHSGAFVLTGNQNLVIANVTAKAKSKIEAILKEHGITPFASSGLRRNSMACVALPTCGLALAESERFLPEVITALEDVLDKAGLKDDDIVIRMTGCPNGCARPYLAEIGLVGRNPGLYNLYLGAAFDGTRLNKLYAEDIDKARMIGLLEPMLEALRQGARGRRAVRRLRDPRGLRAADDRRQPVPRRHRDPQADKLSAPCRTRRRRSFTSVAGDADQRVGRPDQHAREHDPQEPVRHVGGDARAERDARHRADEQEPEDRQVDVAHAEMADARQEGERDCVHDVGADEAPGRQRVIERGERHDADRAGADRGQGYEHAEDESEHEGGPAAHDRGGLRVGGLHGVLLEPGIERDADGAHDERAGQDLADDHAEHAVSGVAR